MRAKWTGLTMLKLSQENTNSNSAHSSKADRGTMRKLFFAFFSKPTFGDLLPFAKAGQILLIALKLLSLVTLENPVLAFILASSKCCS